MAAVQGKIIVRWLTAVLGLLVALAATLLTTTTDANTAVPSACLRVENAESQPPSLVQTTSSPHLRQGIGKVCAEHATGPPLASKGIPTSSRVLPASRIGELGAQEGTVVLGHYSRPFMGGVQETLPILEGAARQLGGRTLSSLPGNMSAIVPELHSASRIVFYTSPNMQGLTAAEMALIQSNPSLMSKTVFVYGGF